MESTSLASDHATSRPLLVITVDTEADDAWGTPDRIALRNLAAVPRFQALCENYSAVPTYLVTYECAVRDESVRVLRPLVSRGLCEIGHHLHVWTTPPFSREDPQGVDVEWIQAYQSELPDSLFVEKADCLHDAILGSFGVAPTSHRAGRWGVDQRTIEWLVRRGYAVDTSVTPLISWRYAKGRRSGGPSFARYPRRPHLWAVRNELTHGESSIVEIPVSVSWRGNVAIELYDRCLDAEWTGARLARRALKRLLAPRLVRPNPDYPLRFFSDALEQSIREGAPIINVMLHSSELAYGCSPSTATRKGVASVWSRLELVLRRARELGLESATLTSAALRLRGSLAMGSPT